MLLQKYDSRMYIIFNSIENHKNIKFKFHIRLYKNFHQLFKINYIVLKAHMNYNQKA